MSGYLALENYSPLLNLVVGMVGFLGIWGCGMLAWKRAHLPSPWAGATAAVSGIMLFGLGCQLIALCGLATRECLGVYLFAWVGAGFCYWVSRGHEFPKLRKSCCPWQLLFLVPAAVNLLMATSGSTKIDETFYHMLMPARIVADQKLWFYSSPWQAAVPQMGYQIALAPFHAIGFPHAGNVVSEMLAVVFAFFVYLLVKQRHSSQFWACLVPSVLLVGMYPVVWYVTGGAHVLGDLTIATAVIACAGYPQAPAGVRPWVWTGAVSTLLVAGAVTKISLLPLVSILWCCHIWQSWDSTKSHSARLGWLGAAILPWFLFYVPMVIWAWMNSGSPFGPVLAGEFGDTIYSIPEIRRAIASPQSRQFHGILPLAGYPHSILVWFLLFAAFFIRGLPKRIPAMAIGIQTALILIMLPWDLRFLGGTQFALIILAGIHFPQKYTERISMEGALRTLTLACLLPWFGLQLFYVAPFASFVFGLTPQPEFYERYIAFYRDFQKLDALLPKHTFLLTTGVRPNSVYFPRNIYTNRMDVRGNVSVFLFACDTPFTELESRIPDSHETRELVYENPSAIISTSRIPGVANKRGDLKVFRLSVR